jgi:hypothetical protein
MMDNSCISTENNEPAGLPAGAGSTRSSYIAGCELTNEIRGVPAGQCPDSAVVVSALCADFEPEARRYTKFPDRALRFRFEFKAGSDKISA